MTTLDQTTRDPSPAAPSMGVGSTPDPAQVERVIKPSRGWIAVDWTELFQARDLFDTLVMRDIRIRYKQTVLGFGWAVLQPLGSMLVLTMVFSNFEGVKPAGVPYPLFLLAGLIPWTFFSSSVTNAGLSLMTQQQLISKVYFPRLFVPAATIGAYLVDMVIGLILMGLVMVFYQTPPSINLIFLPFVLILTFASAMGLGLIFASVTVLYRDLRFIIPYIMQLMMYASPIFYQPSILSRRTQLIVSVNPITGLVTTFRWCILGLPLDVVSLVISLVATFAVLLFGLLFFRRTERYIVDLL